MSFQRGYGPDIGSGARFPNIRPAEARLPKRSVPRKAYRAFWRGTVFGVIAASAIFTGWPVALFRFVGF